MRTVGKMNAAVFEEDITDIGIMRGLASVMGTASNWLRDQTLQEVNVSAKGKKYLQMWNISVNIDTDYDNDLGKSTLSLFIHYDSNEKE